MKANSETFFWNSDRAARVADTDCTKYLESLGYTVINREKDRIYQQMDVDLTAIRDRSITLIELKGDTYDSPNYFAEVVANNNTNTLGCWMLTKSQYMFYYFIKTGELHILPTKKVQEWTSQHMNLKQIHVTTTDKNGNFWYNNTGLLIPKSKIQKDIPEIYVEKIK